MTKIKLMGVREEDEPYIEMWSQQHEVEVDMSKEQLTEDNVQSIEGFDGLSLSQTLPLSETIYNKLNQLGIRQIAQRSAGFDGYDLELASKYGLIISNVPSYSPRSIAEFTVTQAINIVRHFNHIQRKMRLHDFRWEASILSQSIKDLKVAVIGTGHIGGIVAQIFSEGYLCDVVAYDPFPSEHVKPYVTYKQSINEAIKDADIVTIHMPSTQYNNYLFNENMFQMFKKGAVFVNCARGSLVDTKALLSAIEQGQIKGAALDTYEYEVGVYTTDRSEEGLNDPLLEELITREDIIVTPHIAFYTEEAIKHLIFDALDATMEVLNTGTTELRVN